MSRKIRKFMIEIVAVLIALIIYGVPFYFVIINSFKTKAEAAEMNIALAQYLPDNRKL